MFSCSVVNLHFNSSDTWFLFFARIPQIYREGTYTESVEVDRVLWWLDLWLNAERLWGWFSCCVSSHPHHPPSLDISTRTCKDNYVGSLIVPFPVICRQPQCYSKLGIFCCPVTAAPIPQTCLIRRVSGDKETLLLFGGLYNFKSNLHFYCSVTKSHRK